MKKNIENYYRIITAVLPKGLKIFRKKIEKLTYSLVFEIRKAKKGINNFFLIYLILIFFILIYFAAGFYQVLMEVKKEKLEVEKQLLYWKKITKNYPGFPVAYYNAALLSLELREKQEAINLLNRAIYLNPNFKEAENLLSEIDK